MVTAWSVSSDDLALGQEASLHFQARVQGKSSQNCPTSPLAPARSLRHLCPECSLLCSGQALISCFPTPLLLKTQDTVQIPWKFQDTIHIKTDLI